MTKEKKARLRSRHDRGYSGTDAEDHQNWDWWISTYREWAAQNLYQLYPTLTVTNQWTILIATGGSDLKSIIHEAGIDTVSLAGATPTPIEEGISRISDIMEPLSTSMPSHPEAKTEAEELASPTETPVWARLMATPTTEAGAPARRIQKATSAQDLGAGGHYSPHNTREQDHQRGHRDSYWEGYNQGHRDGYKKSRYI